jgi:[ribosomal protein S5]-alanine N-acetyltransferase
MILDTELKGEFFLRDERIQLRTLRATDVQPYYLEWMRDQVIARYSEWRFYEHSLESLTRYAEETWENLNILFCAIRLVESNRHIGNIKLTVNPHSRTADIGILIGEKDCWGQGYATAAIRLLADYALKVLRLRKVFAGAYSSNPASIRAFEKAGFKIEARLERHYLTEEGEVDGVYLARFAEPSNPQDE